MQINSKPGRNIVEGLNNVTGKQGVRNRQLRTMIFSLLARGSPIFPCAWIEPNQQAPSLDPLPHK
jgi:hypothetical protein